MGNGNGNGNGNGSLTGLQQAFVLEYVKDYNATRAAERAGYQGGEATCAQIGSKNLRIGKIRDAIAELIREKHMDEGELLARLAEIARSSIADVMQFKGGAWFLDLDGAHDRGKLYAVKAIRPTQYGTVVYMEDRLRALELLGKALGLFIDKGEADVGDRLASILERVAEAQNAAATEPGEDVAG